MQDNYILKLINNNYEAITNSQENIKIYSAIKTILCIREG